MNLHLATYKAGDYVKVEFANETTGEIEWMWVIVDRCDDVNRILFGRLDNIPTLSCDLRLGQELAISYDKVRQHLEENIRH